jgi:hypothetical protein
MAAIALLVSPASAGSQYTQQSTAARPSAVYEPDDSPDSSKSQKVSHRLIVQLESPSLVEWSKSNLAIQSGGKPDFNAPEAQNHVNTIQAEQAAFVRSLSQALPQASVATYINELGAAVDLTYQVVFNGIAIDAGQSADLKQLRKSLMALPGVRAVYSDIAHDPDLYASVPLINAPTLWNQLGGQENAGAGIKVASMDGGVHKDAPMFSGEGFSYPPGFPKGHVENTNGKIIASRVYFRAWDPPAPGDENPWPGENGTPHGVHTSGIAVGNPVEATYLGITQTISGVAPAAWIMSYRVFYFSVTGDGSFYTAEGLAALEDIVMDGADVVNNSWGAGPTTLGGEFDALDQALIDTSNAGVFVSMSAGNAGPGQGTGDHPSPDYINAAASTTDGTFSAGQLQVTAPVPVTPTLLTDIPFQAAAFGTPLELATVISYTFTTAASEDPTNVEGCNPWPGDPFIGKAVLISRGTCEFGVKVLNAEEAGAEFVVVYNHAAGGDELISMGPGAVGHLVTISSVFIGNTAGTAMVDWHATHGDDSEFSLSTLARQVGNDPDIIVGFSSRGPGVGNTLKPDIAAPGVNILSQGYDPLATGEARHLGFGQVSGTSMAAPHVTGAAAMLRQMHPDWSNAYIKSALMTTSKYIGIFTEDGAHALPLDMGAGRLDLTHAANPGVILDDPSLGFGLVTQGITHTLTVQVTSVATQTETYALSAVLPVAENFIISPTVSLDGFTVSPASITLAPGATETIEVNLDTTTLDVGDHQGYVVLDGAAYDAHFPVWGRVAPEPSAEVLIIDNDASTTLDAPDYAGYYTSALDALGISYDVWDADANFGNPTTIPHAAVLSSYQAVIYFTGDNFFPDGSFTVPTPLTLLDMDRLTEFANGGGILIAMGQDLGAVLNFENSFLYDFVLGGEFLQDSLTGGALPILPVGPYADAPEAFQDVSLDLGAPDSSVVELTGDKEVPPVDTAAFGVANLNYNETTNDLEVEVTVTVSDALTITASHIHTGTVGVNGPILFPLFMGPQVVTDTLTFADTVTLNQAQEDALLSGGLYINVHSTAHPAGEIRGQIGGDGAANQLFIDELATVPGAAPDNPEELKPYVPLLTYPSPTKIEDGVVAMAHRAQPSLESPGIAYLGRSIYTSFGLEGINDGVGSTDRAELLMLFIGWAMDEPAVTISDTTTTNASELTMLEASLTSNIPDTFGVSYRWDFGDGTPYSNVYTSALVSHTYENCGPYTVRVEATDSLGNVAIGTLDINVTNCSDNEAPTDLFLPLIHLMAPAPPAEPTTP